MDKPYPEIFFGLVGAIGTDLETVRELLGECLEAVDYTPIVHRLSGRLKELKKEPWANLPSRNSGAYYEAAIKAGDEFCEKLDDAAAIMALTIEAIRADRKNHIHPNKAYILHSLKRPEEVKLLRRLYGPAAIIISVYSPRAGQSYSFSKHSCRQPTSTSI